MKLVFDARHIGQPFTGLGRYAASLLGALLDSADAPGLAVDVLLHRGPDWAGNFHFQALRRHIDAGRCQLRWVDVPPSRCASTGRWQGRSTRAAATSTSTRTSTRRWASRCRRCSWSTT